ncbi:MAG: 30S ribosomal protein S11 [Lentisphaerae bacterium]|nr:30S ribosomal protein S11 [Lentisphaerota bacterium]
MSEEEVGKEEVAGTAPISEEKVAENKETAESKPVEKAAESTEAVEETAKEVAKEPDAISIVMGDDEAAPAADSRTRRRVRTIPSGIAHITASFNNTQCCITDARGNVIAWSSAGKSGFKGSRKSTAFAGTMIAQDCARTAMAKGMSEVEIRVQGAGAGRESAIRAIANSGINVTVIKDITPIPHNGCRQRKRRRV